MNIYAEYGDKVICDTLDAGYEGDQLIAKKYLTVGTEYTISFTDVDNWRTGVYLEEFPGRNFNSVFFEDVEPLSDEM